MSDIEDMINSVLSDPEQMEKISGLARSLMGSSAAQESSAGAVPDISALSGITGSGLDPAMLGRIAQLMNSDSAASRNEQALLEAMRPYLSEKRRGKMDKAMRIAKLTRLARLAFGDTGGGEGN